jgi:hypothetical protein
LGNFGWKRPNKDTLSILKAANGTIIQLVERWESIFMQRTKRSISLSRVSFRKRQVSSILWSGWRCNRKRNNSSNYRFWRDKISNVNDLLIKN